MLTWLHSTFTHYEKNIQESVLLEHSRRKELRDLFVQKYIVKQFVLLLVLKDIVVLLKKCGKNEVIESACPTV